MDQVTQVMQQMINITEEELESFLNKTSIKTFKRQEIVSTPDSIPNNIFFINKGIIRVFITDSEGTEHTIHFAMENQFIADYFNFIKQQPSFYTLQALEETEVVIYPEKLLSGVTII